MTDTTIKIPTFFPGLRPNRRQFVACSCGAAIIAAAIFGVRWWTTARFMVETDNAYVRADVVTIAPRVAGNVVAVTVADNQRVRAGDVLARIDDRDFRMKVAQAEGAVISAKATVEAQKARIATIVAQSAQQQSVIEQNSAAITAREADAHFTDLELQRQTYLSQRQAGRGQNLESAEAAARKAAAELTEARATLSASRAYLLVLVTQKDAASADLDQARGALGQAEAALDVARLDLERTAIRAPVDGQVGQRSVRAGQYAAIGTPLMAIVPVGTYVIANYKETQIDRIHAGQPVEIVVDAFGGLTLKGHVDGFAPASGAQFALLPPDNATGNFTKIVQRMPLRIVIDPDQPRASDLRPGMSVETAVYTGGDRP
jgi:membrane fusion protein (multidrug efflux system)